MPTTDFPGVRDLTAGNEIFDPPTVSMRSSVGRGFLSTGAAQGIKFGLQIVSIVLLSRLLVPEDFGIMAMAGPIMAFLGMFQSLGLTQATVQRPKIGHDEVNFLFWVNVAASIAVAVVLIAIAPLAVVFYDDPRVGPLITAMALPVLITGSGAQHGALLNRRMEFGRMAIIEVLSGVATLVGAVAWALISPSYWALWGGSLCGAVVVISLTWASSGWRPSRPRRTPEGWSLVNFGAGITGFNFANFFARNLDQILIGRYWGSIELGLYERAYKLLLFPLSQITNPLSKVMIPALSRMTEEPDRYRHAYLRVMGLVLLTILPGVAWATAMADRLIPFLLGSQWTESAPIFAALGFAGLLQPLNNPAGWLFVSQGRSREFMIWGLVTAGFAVTAFGVGIAWGAIGIATAYAISEYIKTPILWWYIGRQGPVGWRDMLRVAWPFVLGGHLAVAGIWAIQPWLPPGTLIALGLTLALAYGIVLMLSLVSASGRAALHELRSLVLGLVARVTRRLGKPFNP